MHQTGWFWHPTLGEADFFSSGIFQEPGFFRSEEQMVPVNGKQPWSRREAMLAALVLVFCIVPALHGQSSGSPSSPPAQSQPAQNIPDAPSAVQPPPPKPVAPPSDSNRSPDQAAPDQSSSQQSGQQQAD